VQVLKPPVLITKAINGTKYASPLVLGLKTFYTILVQGKLSENVEEVAQCLMKLIAEQFGIAK
jgi:hypothetical protein